MPLFISGDIDYIAKMNRPHNKTDISVTSSGTKDLDLSVGYVFVVTASAGSAAATTFTLSNKPSAGTPFEVIIYIKFTSAFAHTFTWPTTTVWPGAVAPSFGNTATRTFIIKLMSPDSGSTYFGEYLSPFIS